MLRIILIRIFNPSSTGSGLNRRESEITAQPEITTSVCIVLIPTVSSKRESAIVKDPNFIALSKKKTCQILMRQILPVLSH